MHVADLIKMFENHQELPFDVDLALAKMREYGNDDDVEFIGVDLDPQILQGAIKIFHARNGVYAADPVRYVNIYYHRGHTVAWQRMICCKELIHLLDPAEANTGTPEAIMELAQKIGLPPEMQNPLNDGPAANLDRLAEWTATAIMLPYAARNLLLEPYRAGRLSLTDVARLADMPSKYAGLVMHEMWDQIYPLLTTKESAL